MKFLTKEQFLACANMQDELNSMIEPDWKQKGYDWNLYIKDEVMEFFTYIGFKHWKEPDKTKSPTDMQAKLEAVDIWHFLLSALLEYAGNNPVERLYSAILSSGIESEAKASEASLRYAVKLLDSDRVSNITKCCLLTDMLRYCDWSWAELYETYIQKFVLNKFRQDNGYKDGSYCKTWKSEITVGEATVPVYKEDNEVLADLVQSRKEYGLEVTNQEGLYNDLLTLYNSRLNK